MWDSLNNNSGGFQFIAILIAILIAVFTALVTWFKEKRNKFRLKRNLLEAIKQELYFNRNWIMDLIPLGEDAARYYDPTRADFKLRDDAVNYAITNGQSILLSEVVLIVALIRESHAVRYVNQQIDEQMMTRFCSPEFSSKMSSLVINNPNIIFEWSKDPDTIPEELRAYGDELRLRHRAINDHGFWQQLKPSLEEAIPLIENNINQMDSRNRWWHFWKD
ncbi:MAG: hypothetical protein ACYC6O_04380 [Thermoleophilia bacterium]